MAIEDRYQGQGPARAGGQRRPDPEATAETADGERWLCGPDSEVRPVISVVLPTLNEEEGVGPCIEQIKASLATLESPAEIVVVDSSTDRTPAIARAKGAIVVEPEESGYGAAYRCGFAHARGDLLVMGDADTTYDFTAMPRLLEPLLLGQADICLGSRFDGRIEQGAMPALHRYVGNPLLTGFLNRFYDTGVTDAHSGFRALTRDALDRLDLRSDGMEFASEMVMAASAANVDVAEVPITYHDRVGEETLDSFQDGWRHVRFMLVNAPGYLFTLPGVTTLLLGTVVMAASLLGVVTAGVAFGIQTMIGGSMLAIVGFQLLCFGVFSSFLGTPIREPRDPLVAGVRSQFRLEYGLAAGAGLTVGGLVAMMYLQAGGTSLPSPVWTLLAATTVVLGLLTVFSSFFVGILTERAGG